ncbi:MAG: nucleotide sugar dehydrogenase [Thioalkalivibrionaceae bacterium]
MGPVPAFIAEPSQESDAFEKPDSTRVAVIGLGYVGLPLAVAFAAHYEVLGFDIDSRRVGELRAGHDRTLEVADAELRAATRLSVTDQRDELRTCDVFIVTVPTPIDSNRRPDLGPLLAASATVGRALKRGDVVIYESTVYPGCTEEDCVPVLERESGLRFNVDFFCGYSPERINPGDHEHRVTTIAKVTSGSTPETAAFVDELYARVITAGTHRAASIRVAEAAKVIENTQRDVNIALINELAMLFARMSIDTRAVLAAAGTKWNFLPFRPGLVGGHCIGVDPYYLTHKAQALGFHPEMILAGRRTNDGMGAFVASRLVKAMLARGVACHGGRVLVLGITFKENCPDLRNTRVIDVIEELKSFGFVVDVHDPWVDAESCVEAYGLQLIDEPEAGAYAGIVLAVAHRQYAEMGEVAIRRFGAAQHVLFDVKGLLPSADLCL